MRLLDIRGIYDVPGLAALADVARHFGVGFRLRGSVLRRLLRAAIQAPGAEAPELFALCGAFESVELVFTGVPDLAPQLHLAIAENVPFAECFEWSLRPFAKDTASTGSPILDAELDERTDGPITRWRSAREMHDMSLTFPTMPVQSAGGMWVDAWPALQYVTAVLDARFPASIATFQPGLAGAEQRMRLATSRSAVSELDGTARSRQDAERAIAALCAAASATASGARVCQAAGVTDWLAFVREHTQDSRLAEVAARCLDLLGTKVNGDATAERSTSYECMVMSEWVNSERARLPVGIDTWAHGVQARTRFIALLNGSEGDTMPGDLPSEPLDLEDGTRVIALSEPVPVATGFVPSSANELCSVLLRIPASNRLAGGTLDENLSVLLLIEEGGKSAIRGIVTPPCVCEMRSAGESGGRARIMAARLALGDLLSRWTVTETGGGDVTIRLAFVRRDVGVAGIDDDEQRGRRAPAVPLAPVGTPATALPLGVMERDAVAT